MAANNQGLNSNCTISVTEVTDFSLVQQIAILPGKITDFFHQTGRIMQVCYYLADTSSQFWGHIWPNQRYQTMLGTYEHIHGLHQSVL